MDEAIRQKVINRFFKYVEKTNDCSIWIGAKSSDGYGSMYVNGRVVGTHRLSYELFVGKIPKGKVICHKCDNPACVNPSHLFLGTQKDNVEDMVNKKRKADLRGEKNPRAITTWDEVREIRKLHKEGIKRAELVKRFNLSIHIIKKIISNITWKEESE